MNKQPYISVGPLGPYPLRGAWWGLVTVCVVLLGARPGYALDKIPDESGPSGFVSLGGAVNRVKNNMIAGTSIKTYTKRTADSLFSSADERTTGSVTFNYDLRYTFAESRTQILLGQQILDVLRFDASTGIGVAQELPDKSVITGRYLFTSIPTKVWADPYVAGQARNKTDRKANGARLTWSGLLGSGYTAQFTYRDIDIDDEDSGQALGLSQSDRKRLKRAGDVYRYDLRYLFDLGDRHHLEPELLYIDRDLDGGAMKNQEFGVQLNYLYRGSGFHVVANAYLARADYDKRNPIYNKTREDDIYGVGGRYFYHDPFGFKDWSAVLGLAWYRGDSNISFYNESFLNASVSALYAF